MTHGVNNEKFILDTLFDLFSSETFVNGLARFASDMKSIKAFNIFDLSESS